MTHDPESGPVPDRREPRTDATDAAVAELTGDQTFTDVVCLAAALCGTPMACLTLVHPAGRHVMAQVGLSDRLAPTADSFCTRVTSTARPVVVPDTMAPLTAAAAADRPANAATTSADDDPAPGAAASAPSAPGGPPARLRFYAGVPVLHDGSVWGALAVLDETPHSPGPEVVDHLERLARQVESRVALHTRERTLRHALQTGADTERRLRALASHLEVAQRIASVGSWENRLDENHLTWSDEIYRIFGLDPADFAPTFDAFLARMHPDDRAAMLRAHDDAVSGLAPLDIEHRIVRPDGTIRHVHERAELIVDHGHHVLAGTVRDITEQVRSTRQFETFFSLAAEPMCIVTTDGTFVRVNLAMSRLLGLEEPDLHWRGIADLVHPDDAGVLAEALAALRSGVPSVARELRCRTVEGEDRTLGWSMRPMLEEGVLYCVVRDDTERSRAEQLLRESEERFREMAETIEDVFWTWDAVNDRILYASPSFETVFGQRRGELYRDSRSFQRLIDPEDLPRLRDAAQSDPHSIHVEYRIVRPDGGRRWLDVRTFPVRDAEGRVVRTVGIGRDVTRLKDAEQALLRTQRMESIGTLAGGIAHDLNNVLTPIVMAAGVLAARPRSSGEADLLETIMTSAERGASMVRQVLAFARGVEGRRTPLQVGTVVSDIARLVRDTFDRRIDVEVDHSPDLWTVAGDATQLHQVLLNLAVNARDAMPEGGHLRIETRNVVIDAEAAAVVPDARPGRHVLLQVSDSGSGIPSGIRDRVFDPFFTTKPLGQGTGLGLSTVQTLVRSHGGFLTFVSEAGVGTTFKVYLPALAEASLADTADAVTAPPRGRGQRVLVVDDEAAVRAVTRTTLETYGYRAVAVGNGAEALARFGEQPDAFDLVITDMMMPVLDGYGTITALRQLQPDLPIIAASGLETQGMVERITRAGVEHFLSKPYTADVLLRTVSQALAAPRPRSSSDEWRRAGGDTSA